MAQQGNKSQRVRTILDDMKLRLTAEPVGNSTKRPSMALSARGRDFYFEVTTNVDGDSEDYGKIGVPLEASEGMVILDRIEHYANPATPAGSEATVVKSQFAWGKRHEKPVVIGKVAVGKEESGAVFISVLSYKDTRPKIKFIFGERFLYSHVRGGTPFSVGEISAMNATAWVKLIRTFLPVALPGQFKIAQEKDDAYWAKRNAEKEGGGSGYSSNGDGKSNYTSSSSSNDDDSDLPF